MKQEDSRDVELRLHLLAETDNKQQELLDDHTEKISHHANWILENRIRVRIWGQVMVFLAFLGLASVVLINDGLAGLARIILGK